MRTRISFSMFLTTLTLALPLIGVGQSTPAAKHAESKPANQKSTSPAGGQQGAAAANSETVQVGETTCTVQALMPSQLENNPRVAQAGVGAATQLRTQFNATQKINPSGQEAIFIDELSAAYYQLADHSFSSCQQTQKGKAQVVAHSSTAETNKQNGATSSSDGTTSSIEATGIPELLSIAEENGAVTSTTSGSTLTLSTSLYGIQKGFGLINDSAQDWLGCEWCTQLGASATFNVAGSSTSSSTTVSRKEISQWQLKYSLFDLSTRSKWVSDHWKPNIAAGMAAGLSPDPQTNPEAYALFEKLKAAFVKVISDHSGAETLTIQSINASQSSSNAGSSSSGGASQDPSQPLAKDILSYLDNDKDFQDTLSAALHSDAFKTFIETAYDTAYNNYTGYISQFEADVTNHSKGISTFKGREAFSGDLTFGEQFPTTTSSSTSSSSSTTTATTPLPAYLVGGVDLAWQPLAKANPAAQSLTSDSSPDEVTNAAKAIQPSKAIPSITLNFKASYYPSPKASLNETAFRGGQAAAQSQWSLGSGPFIKNPDDNSQITFSANGSYERLQENKDQTGKRPDIVSGSMKLTLPLPNGVSFPLAVTFANGTEQKSKGVYTIGNFGVAFDLDKLTALLAVK
jgi:hypothetical protein